MRIYLPDVIDDPILNKGHYMFFRYEGVIFVGELCERDKYTSGTREGEFHIDESDERDFFSHLFSIIEAYFYDIAPKNWDQAIQTLAFTNVESKLARYKLSKYLTLEQSHDGRFYFLSFYFNELADRKKLGFIRCPHQDFGLMLFEIREQLRLMFPEGQGVRQSKRLQNLFEFYRAVVGK